jgi:hypothetical protein
MTDIPHMKDTTDPARTFQMRVKKSFTDKVDAWRRQQPDLPPLAEAIRRLVEKGLEADRKKRK